MQPARQALLSVAAAAAGASSAWGCRWVAAWVHVWPLAKDHKLTRYCHSQLVRVSVALWHGDSLQGQAAVGHALWPAVVEDGGALAGLKVCLLPSVCQAWMSARLERCWCPLKSHEVPLEHTTI